MKQKLQKYFISFLVHSLFNGITEDDILDFRKDGAVYYRGKQLNEEVRQRLIEDAKRYEGSVLFKFLNKEVKQVANLRMFKKGLDEKELIFGRAMLYNLELQEKVIKRLQNID